MLARLLWIGSLLIFSSLANSLFGCQSDGFQSLFNEVDLSGWVHVNTPKETWSVQDKMLICTGKPIGEIRTEKMYQNFILEVEWRHMVPKGNAGIFVWADDITSRGVPFHRGIEVQVLENAYGNTQSHTTHGDIFPIHGATMKPINGRGNGRAFPTEQLSKPSPEWNHYRIHCEDGRISLSVNGTLVTQGTDCNPRKGYICLESEGGVVHYRNLRIKTLPDTPIDPSKVAIPNRGLRSIYTGLDLQGWKSNAESYWKSNDWVLLFDGPDDSDAALETIETFNDIAFVVDLRLLEKDSKAKIEVRKGNRFIDTNRSEIAEALVKQGSWNRFEGMVEKGKLNLKVNGKEVLRDESMENAASALRLIPSGKVEFANIFVK